ncbi:hypothetical protein C0Z17_03250 [Trinickia caryophylli]|nr:hypothetical protein C0Z17_03250 [Trinickia caryophylli]
MPHLFAIHFALGGGFSFVRIRNEFRFISECPPHLLGWFRANSAFLISMRNRWFRDLEPVRRRRFVEAEERVRASAASSPNVSGI